jgi:hypothetical protein
MRGGLIVGTIEFTVDRQNGDDHLGEVDLRASHSHSGAGRSLRRRGGELGGLLFAHAVVHGVVNAQKPE